MCIAAGEVEPRPGVLKLFDEAREAGLKVGVCSAATKSSAICVLESLLGSERFKVSCVLTLMPGVATERCSVYLHGQFPICSSVSCHWQALDVFMAGDDVPNKKPDPSIYEIAAKRLQVDPAECLVIEDSTIGLKVGQYAHQAPTIARPVMSRRTQKSNSTHAGGERRRNEVHNNIHKLH